MTTLDTKASSLARQVFKKSTLAMCVAAFTAQAYAQENTASTQPTALEEVVVYGIKQSLQNAQDLKRDAATVKDVITASDIGALPDKSVVEALQRLPGVSLERFAGSDDPDHFSVEGSGVVVRGLNRTRSEFNGRDSFSASRSSGLNFSDVPPELMGSVEVVKNTTASMTEGGISGTINLVTRKPFDSDSMQLAASIKESYGDRIDDFTPAFSGLFSNRWDTGFGEVGFLLNYSNSRFKARSDGVQSYNFYERSRAAYADPNNLQPVIPDWDPNMNQQTDANGDPMWVIRGDQAIGAPIAGREGDVLVMPPAAMIRRQDNNREREGFASSLQWANTDDTVLATAEYIRSDSTLAWNEHYVEFSDQAFQNPRANDATLRYSDELIAAGISGGAVSFDDDGYFTHGVLAGPKYVNGVRWRKETSLIEDSSLNVQFTPNDNLKIVTDFQYIEAKATVVDNSIHSISETDVYFDLRGDVPEVAFLGKDWAVQDGSLVVNGGAASLTDPQNVTFRSMMDHVSESSGKSVAFQLDGEYTFDEGWIESVETGVRFSDKKQEVFSSAYNWGNISQEWNETAAKCSEYQELCEFYDFGSDFHNGDVLTGNTGFWFPKEYLTRDSVLIDQYVLEEGIHAQNDSAGRVNLRERDGVILGTPYLPTEVYNIGEKRQAAYIQLNFGSDDLSVPIRGNLGLRYISYDLESTGGSNFGGFSEEFLDPSSYQDGTVDISAEDQAFATDSAGVVTTVDAPTYNKVLPSFNINFSLAEGFLIRAAVSEGVYFPDLSNVRNNLTVGANASGTPPNALSEGGLYESVTIDPYTANDVGNPYLLPEESLNVDLTAEWYFSDVGSLTFSTFYKDMTNIHRQAAFVNDVTNPNTGVTRPVAMSGTVNAGDAKIKGFELAYQQTFDMLPAPFNGLGTQFNYTYIDAEQTSENEPLDPSDQEFTFRAFNNLPLEGLSKDTANFILFYENELFDVRFAYNWRSDYLLNSRDVIAFSPVYNEASGQLDASFSWNINDNIKLGLEANNLLDEVTRTNIQYNQAGVVTPRSYFVNDRRFAITLKASL